MGVPMKRNIAVIMLITVVAKFFGFFRDIVLTYYYGASSITDAYLISQTIPTTIFSLIGAGLMTSFIPIYNKVRKERGEEASLSFTTNLINILFFISTVFVILVLLFTEPLVKMFASGFSGEVLLLAVQYTRISVFGLYFTGIIYILSSYLQIHNNFVIPAMLAIPANIVVVISIYMANRLTDDLLAYGILASIIVQFLFLIPSAMKIHFRFRLHIRFSDPYLREIVILAIPVILGVSVNQLNILVDKNLASTIAVGGISVINYADKLITVVQGIFVVPIVTVIYPKFSALAVDLNHKGLKKILQESMTIVSLLVIPLTVGTMVLAKPIIDLIYLRGSFTEEAAVLTSEALFFYSIGLLFYAFRDIFSKIYYSFGDTKTPMINTTIGVAINIALNFILSSFMGISGLALATSISAVVTSMLMWGKLKKKVDQEGEEMTLLPKLLKVTMASLIMGVGVLMIHTQLSGIMGGTASLFLSVSAGVLLYSGLIFFMRIEELDVLLNVVKEKLKRK